MPMKKKTNAPMNSATIRRTASNGSSQSIPLMPPPPPIDLVVLHDDDLLDEHDLARGVRIVHGAGA